MSQPRVPTLVDVARLAGVSRATASRALSATGRVSEVTRQSVLDAAGTLGYVPNRAARELVTRRSNTIALLIPDENAEVYSSPYFSATASGVESMLAETALHMVLLVGQTERAQIRAADFLRSNLVEGVLIVSHQPLPLVAQVLPDVRVPIVFIGAPWEGPLHPCSVEADDYAGGRLAGERLLARGCRRVASITGPLEFADARARWLGWKSAMEDAGVSSDMCIDGGFTWAGATAGARLLADREPRMDGLFVASDLMAIGAMNTLAQRGWRVPDELKIVGFDNIPAAGETQPTLTSVDQPTYEIARMATQILLRRLDGESTESHLRMPCTLVARQSA